MARRRLPALVLAASILVVTGCGGGRAAADGPEAATPTAAPERPRSAAQHLQALQAAADAHEGTRAAGTPGDRASRAYVAGRLRAAGWRVREQAVAFPFFEERRPPRLRGARRGTFAALAYSGSGRVDGAVARVRGRGCTDADWRAVRRDRVAVVARGTCTFASKLNRAQARGAAALVVVSADDVRNGTLGRPGARIPALLVDEATGAAVRRRGRATLSVDAVSETRRTANVLASRPGTGRTVMAGAHLDSVAAGPGANDNGSGSAALLAVAERLGTTRRPVTLGFWGAEEEGLLGSRAYVRGLDRAARGRLATYVNLDMVATPRGRLRVAADDDGLRDVLLRAARGAGLRPTSSAQLNNSSDQASFARAGVPSAFLHTGLDRCYHRRCDTADKADEALLADVSDATTRALRRLASG